MVERGSRRRAGPPDARRSEGRRRAALALLSFASLLAPSPAAPGVRYGDAVPGVVRPADLERIKRALRLDRFSIIAAVWLGATEGREAVIAEPLSDETLGKVKAGCEAGGFCPDPVGFVASRVRIVLLQGAGVETVVIVDLAPRGARGRLADLQDLGVEGGIVGWNGRAEASEGHVALALTPITLDADGVPRAGLDPPLLIRFNPARGRFQVYDCVAGEDGRPVCDFLEESTE